MYTGCPKKNANNSLYRLLEFVMNTQDKAPLCLGYSNSTDNRCRLLFAFAFFLGHPVEAITSLQSD